MALDKDSDDAIGQAINVQVEKVLSVTRDGARVVTLESQARRVLELTDSLDDLQITDPELRAVLVTYRSMAEEALEIRWFWSPWFREGWELFHLRLMPWYHDDGFAAGVKALGLFLTLVALIGWVVISTIYTFVEGDVAGVLQIAGSLAALVAFLVLTCRKPVWEIRHMYYLRHLRQ